MTTELKSIYEIFSDYSKNEINIMLNSLTQKDKEFINKLYDKNRSKKESNDYKQNQINIYYNDLVPRMEELLKRNRVFKIPISQNTNIQISDPYTTKLLALIKEQKSNKEICEILQIDNRQLRESLFYLKNSGITLIKKYYYDGSIRYKTEQDLSRRERDNLQNEPDIRTIITDTKESILRFLAISDLHFGNELERLDLVDRAFNYCSKKGISIILCAGDLIDGPYSEGKQHISDISKQIEYFLNNYPYDKNILTFATVGNHEHDAFESSSLYLPKICDEVRPDIIFGGHNFTSINIKNERILLCHKYNGTISQQETIPIVLFGHSHRYIANYENERLWIIIPPLSNILQSHPSALDITINFGRGYISSATIKQIFFEDKDYISNESKFALKKIENRPKNTPKNTEQYNK